MIVRDTPLLCNGDVLTEVNIYKPLAQTGLCSIDFLVKEVRDIADLNFVVYESSEDDVDSIYNLYCSWFRFDL